MSSRSLRLSALILVSTCALSKAEPLSFRRAYEAATGRSESLQISEADLEQARARLREIRGAVLPQVSIRLSEQVQDSAPVSGQGNVAVSFLDSSKPEARLRVSQALFSGFQDLALLAQAGHERRVREFELEAARRNLAGDLALAFYTALDRGKNLASLDELLRLTQDRMKELVGRVSLGRSRPSEVTAVDLQLRNIQADRAEAAAGSLKSLQSLSFLIGENPTELEDPPDDFLPAEPATPEVLAGRPDLQALQARRDASEQGLSAAKRARWPLIRAEGNYYFYRTGLQKDVDWDALLTLDWALFSGGSVAARMDQARARLEADQARFGQALRQADTQAAAAREDRASSLERLRLYGEAQALAEENFKQQRSDYRLGLATNLEVLGALKDLHEARRNLERARVQARLDDFRLRIISGAPLFEEKAR